MMTHIAKSNEMISHGRNPAKPRNPLDPAAAFDFAGDRVTIPGPMSIDPIITGRIIFDRRHGR
jgi:hypothetical protein